MDPPDDTVLVTFSATAEAPSLASAAELVGLSTEVLDPGFGVVPIEPDRGIFAVLAKADSRPDAAAPGRPQVFSNPRIGAIGSA